MATGPPHTSIRRMPPTPSTSRLSSLLRSRRALVIGGVAVAAIVVGGIVAVAIGSPEPVASQAPTPSATASESASPSPTEEPTPTPTPEPTPVAERCPLDGMPIAEGYEPVAPALAVQIENHPDARPGRNLNNADIVIEATVEGDTTRFTGIYYCDETEGMTGPVRSARYYNIDLWQDLHVLTVGFGASPGAVQRFVNAGMPYPNGIEGGWPWYQRYGTRAAPHNLYVDLEGMRDALDEHSRLMALADRVEELRPPWQFSEDPELPDDAPEVTEIAISTNSFWRFGFTWDEDLEAYLRSDAGVYIEDEATGDPLAPTSVIVQRVTQEVVFGDPDPGGNARRLQHLVGSGTGTLYTLGRAYAIEWSRPTAADKTTWTLAETGEELVLPPGQVWWEILPVESRLTEG